MLYYRQLLWFITTTRGGASLCQHCVLCRNWSFCCSCCACRCCYDWWCKVLPTGWQLKRSLARTLSGLSVCLAVDSIGSVGSVANVFGKLEEGFIVKVRIKGNMDHITPCFVEYYSPYNLNLVSFLVLFNYLQNQLIMTNFKSKMNAFSYIWFGVVANCFHWESFCTNILWKMLNQRFAIMLPCEPSYLSAEMYASITAILLMSWYLSLNLRL